MVAKAQNFEMVSGDTARITFTVLDNADSPVNLAGAAIAWHLAKNNASASIVVKSLGAGVTITDAPAGKFRVDLAPDDTAGLAGGYYHEAQVIDTGGNVSTVAVGKIKILRDLIA